KSWEASLRGVRQPLGTVQSRTVRGTKEATSLPGAPDGHYVVIELQTSFSAKASAIETVTFMEERDGTGRAAGYFIRLGVHRGGAKMGFKHVLVPTDLSDPAKHALRCAIEEATLHRAKMTVLHVLPENSGTEVYYDGPRGGAPQEAVDPSGG